MLKFYNTLSHKIESFKPIKAGQVKLYSCGPTVYNYVHLGNLRAYVFVDLLKRYLKYRGFQVKHVMNITDVDDKTIKGSQTAKKTLKEFTNFYLKEFLNDLKSMNIKMSDFMPKATEHIAEIVELIEKLAKKKYTYQVNGSIYFRISQFKNYGVLAQLDKQLLKENAAGRLNLKDEYGKEEANDFVLWKAWQPEDGEVFWDTTLGRGRPGWHIECSVMAMKYLGENFDIHCGGVDLIFPHHTNEIAQAEAATGQKFVNYWLHNAHLVVDGQKMSKSLGNFYTLQDIKNKKLNPLLLRLILLKTHYRQTLNFSFKDFDEARAIASKFLNFLIELDEKRHQNTNTHKSTNIHKLIMNCRKRFQAALDDDLNISQALAEVFNFISKINLMTCDVISLNQAQEIKNFILELDEILGFINLLYENYQEKKNKLFQNKTIKDLIQKRNDLRKNKDYAAADKIRNELLKKGIVINDTAEGYDVRLSEIL